MHFKTLVYYEVRVSGALVVSMATVVMYEINPFCTWEPVQGP